MARKTVHRKKTTDSPARAGKATRTKTTTSSDADRWTCAFDNGDTSLAVVRSGVNGHRVRVIDVHTGAQRSEYASDGAATKVTAVAWGSEENSKDTQTSSKKPVVVLGLHSGTVLLFSPARNAVIREFGSHESPVVDVDFGNGTVFSLDSDGTVVHWDVASGKQLARLRTGIGGAQRLLVATSSDSMQRVVVASHKIEMWDIATASRIQTWPGHTAPVHTLLWAADETALVSAAEDDRHVQVWDAAASPTTGSTTTVGGSRARALLAADSEVVYVDVSPSGSVLAVGQNGIVYAWHQVAVAQRTTATSKRSALGYPPDGVLKIVSSLDKTVLGVHVARFSRVTGDDESNVLVVRGSSLKPLFETLSFASSDGSHNQFERELVVVRDAEVNMLVGSMQGKTEAEKQVAAQLHAYDEAGATVTNVTADGVRKSQRAFADSEQGVPTLADRIKQLSVANDTSSAPTDALKLSAGTLVRVLVQSLHTADPEMLETVLMNSARTTVVRDTVLGLPTAYVLPFLQQLFVRFQGNCNPVRAQQLLPWIRHTLALHSAYLMSIPSLVPQLAGFYQSLESRLESHHRLLKLSGRLELANMQIRARSHYEKERLKQEQDAQKQTSMQPLNVYHESEDEDDDDESGSMTEPATPVWQAEESTDSEDLSDSGAAAMDEDAQWTDSDHTSESDDDGDDSDGDIQSGTDDDDDDGDSGAGSDSSGGDKIML
ncbi:Small subunit (SSU) processome component [Coemansia sp. RSA 1813]|nr:Small subunit (SSU) processome component [Coemansia sp. RSA 1646]KAJ1767159.1 Small subunit (SSU) processome component [Coemansia sp. RSA 1843]KAJ2210633.1 Small subunit (SSU) processome component [Coemansia sp. RSA 487]KAJ2563378.1 Small subunit (SSU) processome component [Coemansia sp. RSA 1813]